VIPLVCLARVGTWVDWLKFIKIARTGVCLVGMLCTAAKAGRITIYIKGSFGD